MKKRLEYIHEVRYLENDKPGAIFDIIKTKKYFKRAIIDYYSNEDKVDPLCFKLLNSPNTQVSKIIPYINRRGNKDICFANLTNETGSTNRFTENF